MRILPLIVLVALAMPASPSQAQDESHSTSATEASASFLQVGQWWNLYFADDEDPLRRGNVTINAVKIVQLSKTHPSWVQIAFPADQKEHLSILKPAAKAKDDESIDLAAALTEWETSVTDWKVIWVNLDFVVRMSRVEVPQAKTAVSR